MFLGSSRDLGADGSFLIAPNSFIAGNVHRDGKLIRLCIGEKDYPKECYPNAAWDFEVGDVIYFTWGMTEGREGKLVYAIVPSGIL